VDIKGQDDIGSTEPDGENGGPIKKEKGPKMTSPFSLCWSNRGER